MNANAFSIYRKAQRPPFSYSAIFCPAFSNFWLKHYTTGTIHLLIRQIHDMLKYILFPKLT
jgi:hypothetical protein